MSRYKRFQDGSGISSQWLLETELLVSIVVITILTFAGAKEHNDYSLQSDDELPSSISIPFPGTQWLDRMASQSKDVSLESNSQTYSSAYDAFLYGEPLKNPCRNFNAWVNSFFFGTEFAAMVIRKVGVEWAHYLLCYLRNFVGAMVIYYGAGGIFHYFRYIHPMSKEVFKDRVRPSSEIIWHQIRLSQMSMTIVVCLPVLGEWLVESGWTKCYYTIDEIGGWPNHIATTVLYFVFVEIGIYWVHRTLHTNKWLYNNLHCVHHYYNKAEMLTPWASVALHPLDGILLAGPYVGFLPFIPCHYLIHFGLLAFTALWGTCIHDAMNWNWDGIMGTKYHTIHHTHYIYNYGQVLVFCDWFWGTLRVPDGHTGVPLNRKRN